MIKKSDNKKDNDNKIAQIPICRECGAILTDENWYPSFKKRNSCICKKCEYEYVKKWQRNNRDQYNQLAREENQRLRDEVFDAYGGECACCGEARKEYLSIDHKNGNGKKHRKEIGATGSGGLYRWLKQNNYPEGFQVLCFNCNCGKENYSVCPYDKEAFEKEFETKLKKSYGSRYYWALKLDIIENYGNKCALCDKDNPHCLTIDHVNGRSLEDNSTGKALYLKLKNENYPKDNYRLLCYNCNCALGFGRITEEEIIKYISEKKDNTKSL